MLASIAVGVQNVGTLGISMAHLGPVETNLFECPTALSPAHSEPRDMPTELEFATSGLSLKIL